MTATNWARNKLLDYAFGSVSFTPPSSYWLGLSTTTISTSGSNATEPVGAGYARIQVTNDKTRFTNASSGSLVNSTTLSMAESSGSWGTITTVFLTSASTSGSIWFYTDLASPIAVATLTTVTFSASAIQISMT